MLKPFLHDWLREVTGFPVQALSRSWLETYQLGLLKQQLTFAKAYSPFYSRHYAGYKPQQLESLDDFATWPLTYPIDLKQSNDDFLCTSPSKVWRVITMRTSGTTGPPKRLFFSEADLERTARYFHYSLKLLACDCRNLLVLMPGNVPGSVGDILTKSLEDLPIRCHQFGIITDFATTLDYIKKHDIDFIIGVPSQVLSLCRYTMQNDGLDQIKGVLLAADYITPHCVATIEKHWQCRVIKHYGSTETALGAAVNCDCYTGGHIREADLLFETIDPITKQPIPDGEIGEIVISSLNYGCMPLLRYNTGDLGALTKLPCQCKSILKRLTKMHPRHTISLNHGVNLDINELDALLYQIEALPYFEAELHDAADGSPVLELIIDAKLRPVLAEKITHSLQSLPAVLQALLTIKIIGRHNMRLGNPYVLKRKINDLRKPVSGKD